MCVKISSNNFCGLFFCFISSFPSISCVSSTNENHFGQVQKKFFFSTSSRWIGKDKKKKILNILQLVFFRCVVDFFRSSLCWVEWLAHCLQCLYLDSRWHSLKISFIDTFYGNFLKIFLLHFFGDSFVGWVRIFWGSFGYFFMGWLEF